ncbi:MAG: NosD domain-containing protein [Planctomycetota bacterium]
MRVLCVLFLASVAWPADHEIKADRKWEKGVVRLAQPLRVVADGVTLDLGQAEFVGGTGDPDTFEGIGIVVEGRRNVTIRGGSLRGFRCAILIKDCENVVVRGVEVSRNFRQRLGSTPAREDARDWLRPHDNDKQEWRKRYGAGICIENSKAVEVDECVGRHQQNGLLLDRATACRITNNDFSFNSGWGIALWRSSGNLISQNQCDWCVRGYSHGVYDRGQDSAGILLFEQCSDNVIFRNSATHSGDGLFLYAGEETLRRTGRGGSNRNLVVYNDFRYAVANAIEATFSQGNRFIGNRCSYSRYGIWAGYSYGSLFEGNMIEECRIAGIAIEHGRENRIVYNNFRANPRAIRLWWDDDEELLATAFARTNGASSRTYLIAANSFYGDGVAIDLRDTSNVAILANNFEKVGRTLAQAGRCENVRVGEDEPEDLEGTKLEQQLPKHRDVFLRADHPKGMTAIIVDEWGPIDPQQPYLFPRAQVDWEGCLFRYGGGLPQWTIDGARVVAENGRLVVLAPRDGLTEFKGEARIGERTFPFEGVVLRARWTVRHWNWTDDPRKAWRVPADTPSRVVKRLAFAWGSAGPEGLKPDRFATRAETRMPLPAGTYELRTRSDDGVRVTVNGEVVLEDWTHHAPKETVARVTLPKGEHTIVVEHFELDGHAELSFDLRPVR